MSLSRIQSLRLAAVLEDCSDQLDILGHTLTVQINRDGEPAAAQKAMLTELRRHCQCVSQQVSQLHLELEEKQTFSSLQQAMEEVEQEEATGTRRDTKRELEQKKQTLKRRQEELQQKNEKLQVRNEKLQDMERLIKDLTQQLNEQSTKTDNMERFVKKEQELQLQQGQKESIQAEKLLDDQVELLQEELTETKRAHEYSEVFLQNQHKELQQQLQQWQQRTEQMLQQKQQQLNDVCCKKTVLLDRLAEMKKMFREMEQMVMEDREEQEKQFQQQAKARAATTLQAWWRGCMVRRGLGSFKKAKEEKKMKKMKKKGKKKK